MSLGSAELSNGNEGKTIYGKAAIVGPCHQLTASP